jgi:hypothetical protein
MRIWWGWRLGFDCTLLYVVLNYFSLYPTYFWRHAKMEPVRWTQRRRQFLNNPYFSNPKLWTNNYDNKFNIVGQL